MKINTHSKLLMIFAVLFSISITGACASQPIFAEPGISHMPIVADDSMQLIWSIDEVYVSQNDFQPMMSASSGLVCFLGDLAYPPQNKLTCLDSKSGALSWQKTINVPDGILMNSDGVYVSNGGVAGIKKFDQTGKLAWDVSLNETSVKYMYLYKHQLQLFLLPEKFMALESGTGSQIASLDGERIIYSTESENFVINYSLESRSLDLADIYWQLDISSANIRMAPAFLPNLILLRTGRVIGTLLAIDRATGHTSWETDDTIISNVLYWSPKSTLFVLNKSGELLSINIDNGSQVDMLNFSPGDLVLNGDDVVGGYELAFDEDNNILFILLGDSRQLFAFKIE